VIRITFAFPAKLYHFQWLAGRTRPAVVIPMDGLG
jgi:hypothetical protein